MELMESLAALGRHTLDWIQGLAWQASLLPSLLGGSLGAWLTVRSTNRRHKLVDQRAREQEANSLSTLLDEFVLECGSYVADMPEAIAAAYRGETNMLYNRRRPAFQLPSGIGFAHIEAGLMKRISFLPTRIKQFELYCDAMQEIPPDVAEECIKGYGKFGLEAHELSQSLLKDRSSEDADRWDKTYWDVLDTVRKAAEKDINKQVVPAPPL
ncbi:hypothetical protein [Alcaligenes faecalis]|uniref:hypothetical protein n=1 Tax=Alcaligenes faecalis TaxID=511 RepID=UPI001EEFFDBD|nr:hypothetical protein [Alcaligenes faecalis]ULH06467.1 hypothetical protein MF263_17580 [Alcaligenes faecalis]